MFQPCRVPCCLKMSVSISMAVRELSRDSFLLCGINTSCAPAVQAVLLTEKMSGSAARELCAMAAARCPDSTALARRNTSLGTPQPPQAAAIGGGVVLHWLSFLPSGSIAALWIVCVPCYDDPDHDHDQEGAVYRGACTALYLQQSLHSTLVAA